MAKLVMHWPERGIENGEFTGSGFDDETLELIEAYRENKIFRRAMQFIYLVTGLIEFILLGIASATIAFLGFQFGILPYDSAAIFWSIIAISFILYILNGLSRYAISIDINSVVFAVVATFVGYFLRVVQWVQSRYSGMNNQDIDKIAKQEDWQSSVRKAMISAEFGEDRQTKNGILSRK